VGELLCLSLSEEVSHPCLLGLEIALGKRRCRRHFGGDALNHSNTLFFERGNLFGIVGDEAHCVNAQELESLCGNLEEAAVRLVSKFEIGLDGVKPLVLELVGAQLGHQADAATFLLLVDQDAGAFVDDALHGELELLAAVAAQRAKDVAGEALGMNADDGRRRVDIAEHKCDAAFYATGGRRITRPTGLRLGNDTFKTMDAEMSPAGGEVCLRYLADRDRGHA